MKLNLSFRVIVIILFIFLYLGSIIVLNIFFNQQQHEIDRAYKSFHIDESLAELNFKTNADSLKAKELATNIRESLMAIEIIRVETQIYSVLFVMILMVISIAVFVMIFYKITKPLQELQVATAKIREGDYSVYLPNSGIKEMRQLQQSFNSMSKELEDTQKKLILAEKEMIWKEISRMLAHEIKNPLTPIQLSVQRLEEKFSSDSEKFRNIFPESIRIIIQEVENLKQLVHRFSSFAKISTPKMQILDPACELKRICEPYLYNYNIELELTEGLKIKFDPTHLYQIITNILQNAIDASNSDDKIHIVLMKYEEEVQIQIMDQGKGIKPSQIDHIFEPYFTRKERGTGLGLAIVKKLIEANNADIKVNSIVGEKTTVEIIIKEYR